MEKKIYFCWLQGLENAPTLVRKNYQSWVQKNQDWDIKLIDNNSVKEFVDIDSILGINKEYITYASLSDVIRINILNNYGGVWVDATTFCMKPLNEWLMEAMPENISLLLVSLFI